MTQNSPNSPWRFLGIAILTAGVILLAFNGRQWWPLVQQMVVDGGGTGFLLFMAAFIVLSTLCFPVSIMGFTAGALYGPWQGLLLVFPSGIMAGVLIFVLGRTLLRGFVQNLIQSNAKLSAVEKIAGQEALRLNILTRLSPFNYGFASYALAVGKSSFRAYLLGSLAILPSSLAQVWVGALAGKTGDLSQTGIRGNGLEMVVLVVGVLFFIVLSWQVNKMVKRALRSEDFSSDD